jgi:hypothetical protein
MRQGLSLPQAFAGSMARCDFVVKIPKLSPRAVVKYFQKGVIPVKKMHND